MSSIGTGYDLSAHQFSPDGRVFQVEYANKAVQNSSTAVALRCKDGVVFGVEKLITSKLYEPGTGRRIFSIDRHIGMAVSGLMSDARQIVGIARNEAAYYRSIYGSPIPLKTLSDKVAGYIHVYTLYSAYRPFGCSVFLSSYDKVDGPELYMIEPSGTSYRPVEICGSMLPLGKFYNIGKEGGMNFLSNALLHGSFKGYSGCSVGKAKQNAKTEIEKLKLENLTMKEGIKEVAKIIHIVHDEVKDKHFELELSWVGEGTNGIHQMVPKELANDAEEHAKKAIEEDSDSDDDL